MDRRTAIRTLATVTALPVLAPDNAMALMHARSVLDTRPVEPFVPVTLSENELEIVGLVADVILPRTQTPSATDVAVPQFIDLLATEWMDDEELSDLRAGLAELDDAAGQRFGRTFTACDGIQQSALVQELDDQLPAPFTDGEIPRGFYPTLKRRVLTGYFTTRAGAASVGYRLSPGAYAGCVAPGSGQ